MPEHDPRDPRFELARKLAKRDRVRPSLTGASTAGGSNPVNPVFNLPTGGLEGEVLTLVDVGGGSLLPAWEAAPGVGIGSHYLQYLWEIDGSGGWGFVEEEIGGQMYPVMDLFATE